MKLFIRSRVIKTTRVFNERSYEFAVKSRLGFEKKGEIIMYLIQKKDD